MMRGKRSRHLGRVLCLVAGVSLAAAACRPATPPARDLEGAYRANNRGIAHLERFEYPQAAAAFRDALQIDNGLAAARFNLSLALLYSQDFPAAEREAAEAARLLPAAPQPPYVRGLIARAENRTADALRELERVRAIDAGDAGTNVNLGQILLEERRYDEAIPLLRAAAEAEPANVTAAYNLGLALTRAGRDAEGREMLTRAQALRSVGYSITYGNGYLEQGAYAEAIGSTGAEPDLVDARLPRNTFRSSVVASLPGAGGGVALVDVDDDGDLDLFVASAAGERLFENTGGGGWRDVTSAAGLAERRGGIGAAAGDYDNDGRADLLALRREGSAL
jgi:tetratricopeptide (TPR) repeat protein